MLNWYSGQEALVAKTYPASWNFDISLYRNYHPTGYIDTRSYILQSYFSRSLIE